MPSANGVAESARGPQKSCFPLSLDNINPKVKEAQYAVRCVCTLKQSPKINALNGQNP